MQGKNLKELQIELTRDEARRSKLYKCSAGYLTIGIGHNIEANGLKPEVIDLIFKLDVEDAEQYCKKYPWYDSLDPVRKRAIVNLMFNLGPNTFKKFKKAIAAMGNKDYIEASAQFKDSNWYKQVGARAKRVCYMIRHGKIA